MRRALVTPMPHSQGRYGSTGLTVRDTTNTRTSLRLQLCAPALCSSFGSGSGSSSGSGLSYLANDRLPTPCSFLSDPGHRCPLVGRGEGWGAKGRVAGREDAVDSIFREE